MGKTYRGGGSDFWKNYDGDNGPTDGSDFWEDQDMWRAMREADEASISADEAQALDYGPEDEMTCANCASVLTGPDDFGDYQDTAKSLQCPDGNWHAPALDDALMDEIDGQLELNNIDLALEQGRSFDHYATTAVGNCKGCGQRYGHSVYCPVINPKVSHITTTRRADAKAAFTSREYKDWSKAYRGGPDSHKGTKPTAVLVDMDGTIDDAGRANHFGMDYVHRMHKAGHVIVIGTARTMEFEYERSHKWLVRELSHKYGIPFIGPFCRSRDDRRFACHFKRGLIETLSGLYDFVGAIDDDRYCLSELRKIDGLEVVTAKPGIIIPQPWRRTYKGPKQPRHAKG